MFPNMGINLHIFIFIRLNIENLWKSSKLTITSEELKNYLTEISF
jgi:hypothetical protein